MHMDMNLDVRGEDLFIAVSGKLDTISAMDLDEKLNDIPEQVKNIYFDFDGLSYIASAGLRVLYWAQEYSEEKGGSSSIKNISPEVMEILTITGFKEFINIE